MAVRLMAECSGRRPGKCTGLVGNVWDVLAVKDENGFMKPFSLLLVGICLAASGCHKSTSTPSINQQWKWVESDLVMGANSTKTYPGPDTTIYLQYLPNHQYEVLLNGQVLSTGSYVFQIGADSTITFNGRLSTSTTLEFGLGGRYGYSTSTTSDTIILVSDGSPTAVGVIFEMKFVGIF
jgi:hypothetical protein